MHALSMCHSTPMGKHHTDRYTASYTVYICKFVHGVLALLGLHALMSQNTTPQAV
jgi:hypothetical protein